MPTLPDESNRAHPSFNPRSRNRNRGGHSQILTLIWKTTGPYDSEQHRFHRHRSSGVPTPWSGPSHATSLTIGASYRNRSRPTRTCPRSARNSPVHHHISSSLSDIESRDEVNEDTARERLRDERLRIEKLLDQTTTDGLDDRASAGEQGDMTDPAGPLIAEQEEDAVSAGLRERLRSIERAEQRLIDGTYGRSLRSGQPIPDDRLEADPAAELTVDEA